MNNVIFTIYLKSTENPVDFQRIEKVLAGNQEVRCTEVALDFKAQESGMLTLRIPLRYVNLIFVSPDDEE